MSGDPGWMDGWWGCRGDDEVRKRGNGGGGEGEGGIMSCVVTFVYQTQLVSRIL